MKPIRVLVVDDQAIVRKGICALLTQAEGLAVVGEAAEGQEAVSKAAALQPDVVLMDLVMPGIDGIEATRQITTHLPGVRVLVLTSFTGDDMIFPAIKAGALGYLLKDSEPANLIRAIRRIHSGEPSLHPNVASKVLRELRNPTSQDPPTPDPLTDREVEVLRLVAQGVTNEEIADRLSIAVVTVRSHVSHILDKLHLANRVQATLYALREGLASLDDGGGEAMQ